MRQDSAGPRLLARYHSSDPACRLPSPRLPAPSIAPHSPFAIHHLPFTIHSSPFTLHSLLFTIHYSPFTAFSSLFPPVPLLHHVLPQRFLPGPHVIRVYPLIGSVRTRMRSDSRTTMLPCSSASWIAARLASNNANCDPGRFCG